MRPSTVRRLVLPTLLLCIGPTACRPAPPPAATPPTVANAPAPAVQTQVVVLPAPPPIQPEVRHDLMTEGPADIAADSEALAFSASTAKGTRRGGGLRPGSSRAASGHGSAS